MSSPPHSEAASPASIAEAIERRLRTQPLSHPAQEAKEYELRQHFRRLIQGIVRPNSREVAMEGMKTILMLGENILREPDNPKFQKFKPTNTTIENKLVKPKGTIEYCREMGWNPEVENFQPFYIFDKRKLPELEIGVAMLKEHVELETAKLEREAQNRKEEKAAREAVKSNVKLAFMEDRKSKLEHDAREKQLREARMTARSRQSVELEAAEALHVSMPGEGRSISGQVVPALPTSPPPYSADDD